MSSVAIARTALELILVGTIVILAIEVRSLTRSRRYWRDLADARKQRLRAIRSEAYGIHAERPTRRAPGPQASLAATVAATAPHVATYRPGKAVPMPPPATITAVLPKVKEGTPK